MSNYNEDEFDMSEDGIDEEIDNEIGNDIDDESVFNKTQVPLVVEESQEIEQEEQLVEEPELTLNTLIEGLENILGDKYNNIAYVRNLVFDKYIKTYIENKGLDYDTTILSFSRSEDNKYFSLFKSCFPKLEPVINAVGTNTKNRGSLIEAMTCVVSSLLWLSLAEGKVDLTQFKGKGYVYPFTLVLNGQIPSNISSVATEGDVTTSFYDVVAIIEALNSDVQAAVPVTEETLEEIEDDELAPEIEANTARVMQVYKDLFEVGFELKLPYGLLVKEGALKLGKGGTTKLYKNQSLVNLYNMIKGMTGDFLVQSEITEGTKAGELRKINMRKGTSYYPEFQLGNLYGLLGHKRVDSWSEFSSNIEQEVKANMRDNIENGKDILSIVDTLTTCIVITEFDPKSAMKLRFNIGDKLAKKQRFELGYNAVKSTILSGMGNLFQLNVLPSGVMEVTLVFNEVAFNGKPLFAYEAIDALKKRGRLPSLKDMILGQDLSGKIMTTNLDRDAACVILIGAGQRSGKGVLTLNMLGTILAGGNPLIYCDGKPDMATVLWDLSKKYGLKPAVWDANDSHGFSIGQNAPEEVRVNIGGIFGILAYLKVIQLMMVAATLAAKGVKPTDKRPFFVFDEALAVQSTLKSIWSSVLSLAKTDKEGEAGAWCKEIANWCKSLANSLDAVINSQLPMSGISTVWLFQSMQPTNWSTYDTAGLTSGDGKFNILKTPIMSRLSLKILGRGTADSEYGLGKVKEHKDISGRVLSEGGRHFAMTGSQKISDMEAVTVFKPYLVLNTSENGTRAVEQLKSNVSADVWKTIAPTGELNKGAGFEGFASMLGESAIQNLNNGRTYLEQILDYTPLKGRYSSLEEYLYDCDIESFKSVGVLTLDMTSNDSQNEQSTGGYNSNITNEAYVPGESGIEDFENFKEPAIDDYEGLEEEQEVMPDNEGYSVPYRTTKGFDGDGPYDPIKESVQQPYVSPNETNNYSNVYQEPLKLRNNPFGAYGTSEKPMSCLNALSHMSSILMKEIKKVFGDYSRVHSIEITSTGLVLNDIAFRPKFSEEDIKLMPFDIQRGVARGNIIELINFNDLYKFSNLTILTIDNVTLAESRVRREMTIGTKPWSILFKKFRHLNRLIIGGREITDAATAQAYDNEGRGGYSIMEGLKTTLGAGVGVLTSSRMSRFWDSKPVKVTTGALGWTLGAKALMMGASMFGPWGLLFGAFAVAGAIGSRRK